MNCSVFFLGCLGSYKVMASAAPQKRMVSSFFITLASPHRATVTQQQQPPLQTHSASASDIQHTAVRVSPSASVPSLRRKKEDHLQADPSGSSDSKGRTRTGVSAKTLPPQNPKPVEAGSGRGKLKEDNKGAAGVHEVLGSVRFDINKQ